MDLKELFQETWSSLRQNKLRTTLTGLAVAWGIFLLIAMLGAGNGLLNALLNNSSGMDNSMSAYSWLTSKPYKGYDANRKLKIEEGDVGILTREPFADKVGDICPLVEKTTVLTYGDFYLDCELVGVEDSYLKIKNMDLCKGRFINSRDSQEKRKVVVLGDDNAKQICGDEDYGKLLGKTVKMGGFSYLVVGIYRSHEDNTHSVAYAPYTTIQAIYNINEIEQIQFSVKGIETVEESEDFVNAYRKAFNSRHFAAPDDKAGVWINNNISTSAQVGKSIRILRLAIWILGLMSLISGIVGVSNIMLITVKERTHEFGIRKAIGARPSSILGLIITESVSITLIFGYLGMVMGLVANHVMDLRLGGVTMDMGILQMKMFDNPTVGLDVAVEAVLVLIVAGTIAGMIPAYKASKVKPIEALRG